MPPAFPKRIGFLRIGWRAWRAARPALAKLIASLPETSPLFWWAMRGLHTSDFLVNHRRLPGKPRHGFNDFLFQQKTSATLGEPLRRRVTDKEYGKSYIEARLGTGRTIGTVAVLRSATEIDGFQPDLFPVVVKPTHSSGRWIVVHDHAAYLAAVPEMKKWLKHCYFQSSLELNYRGLEKKVIVESYLSTDFHFEGSIHCRDGRPKVISVIDRFSTDQRRASLDAQWQPLHVALGKPYRPMDPPVLPYRDRLLEEAAILGEPFDYIRIDFYGSTDAFVFGELTNLPAGGLGRFDPPEGASRFNTAFFIDAEEPTRGNRSGEGTHPSAVGCSPT